MDFIYNKMTVVITSVITSEAPIEGSALDKTFEIFLLFINNIVNHNHIKYISEVKEYMLLSQSVSYVLAWLLH